MSNTGMTIIVHYRIRTIHNLLFKTFSRRQLPLQLRFRQRQRRLASGSQQHKQRFQILGASTKVGSTGLEAIFTIKNEGLNVWGHIVTGTPVFRSGRTTVDSPCHRPRIRSTHPSIVHNFSISYLPTLTRINYLFKRESVVSIISI